MVDTLLLLVPLKRPPSISSWPILTSEVAESIKNIYLGAQQQFIECQPELTAALHLHRVARQR